MYLGSVLSILPSICFDWQIGLEKVIQRNGMQETEEILDGILS